MRWLHLRLEAPMAAFGGVMIGSHGVIGNFPARSMMTGLFANALGWHRSQRSEHQALQNRLVYGIAWNGDPGRGRMTDYQTAQLGKNDRAWTTRGTPAKRAGGPATYEGADQSWRDYHTDVEIDVVVRLEPADAAPTIEDLAHALDRPNRPLFIGRKSCLPSSPLFDGWVDSGSVREALCAALPAGLAGRLAFWPGAEGGAGAHRITAVTDERDWMSGVHGGERHVCEGLIDSSRSEA